MTGSQVPALKGESLRCQTLQHRQIDRLFEVPQLGYVFHRRALTEQHHTYCEDLVRLAGTFTNRQFRVHTEGDVLRRESRERARTFTQR
jgi:hypothetical protein